MNDNNKPKANYKLKNWSAYNKALRDRYSITVWLSDDVLSVWYAPECSKRGHPQVYSNKAIEAALTIGAVFGLPLRGCQGFVDSLFALLRSEL